jgi:acetyl-CoA C-acetyltransferase
MSHREIFVASTARTAIGTFGGSLKDVPNSRLATIAVQAAIQRAGIAPDAVGHVVMGNVIPTDTKDAYLARVAAIDAGCPIETPAFNVNRLCGSGLQAIVSAAQAIGYGDCDVAVAGGSESMSRGPYFDQGARWGQRMGDSRSIDYRTSSRWKASAAPPPPSRRAASRNRSSPSRSPPARARSCSRKTSMCAPPPRWRCWPA